MSGTKVKVNTKLEGYVTSVAIQLEDLVIDLAYDGDKTWTASNVLETKDNVLDLVMQCRGWYNAAWKLEVTINDEEKPKYKRKGKIGEKNYSIIEKKIKLS